jgi:plasmid stabilization system protein ParE
MKYQIELAATAKADIRSQAHWLLEQVAPAAAEKWLDGLYKAIATLQTRPLRCPVAAESDRFPEEIRELHYGKSGKRQHKHRIIFAIHNETVHVLYVRHTARDELEPRRYHRFRAFRPAIGRTSPVTVQDRASDRLV